MYPTSSDELKSGFAANEEFTKKPVRCHGAAVFRYVGISRHNNSSFLIPHSSFQIPICIEIPLLM